MNPPAKRGRPPGTRNQNPKLTGLREPERFNDRYTWRLVRRHLDQFLTERGLRP